MPARPVRVRMAPSPTGPLHVGSARTALFNWLFARHHDGVFLLRVDDTDTARSSREDEEYIYDGFRWLGLEWDEGPFRQSERLDVYREHAARLLSQGHAYRCYCTPEELAAERRQAEAEKRPYVYSRRCLSDPPKDRAEFTVRLKMPARTFTVEDLIRGPLSFEGGLVGDFVIMKSDGWPTYIFSSPVDDALLQVTHVIRAEEHISNLPKQLAVLEALGYEGPAHWAHLPLILAPDRTKLSKRRHPVLLTQYRDWGFLPEAMVNYCALLGWNPGGEQEIFTRSELVQLFDLEQVQKAGAIFDRQKLEWMNGEYIRALPLPDLRRRLEPFLPELDERRQEIAAAALQERMKTLADGRELLAYLERAPEPPAPSADERERLRTATEALRGAAWEPDAITACLDGLLERQGWSRNQLFKPIRAAVVGGNSPQIGPTLALLDREEAFRRLEAAC